MTATSLWLGPSAAEGTALFKRCLESGLNARRAYIVGHVGSYKDGWVFRRTLAEIAKCSIRTVQRALTQAKQEGLIGIARAKKDDIPPGAKSKFDHGFSHRWTVGWGFAGEAVKRAVQAAKGLRLVRMATAAASAPPLRRTETAAASGIPPKPGAAAPRPEYQKRKWTADELDAELQRLERLKRPPD